MTDNARGEAIENHIGHLDFTLPPDAFILDSAMIIPYLLPLMRGSNEYTQ
jgi:hypothetical protein